MLKIAVIVLSILLVLSLLYIYATRRVDGLLHVERTEEKDSYLFEVDDLEKIADRKFLRIKVKRK